MDMTKRRPRAKAPVTPNSPRTAVAVGISMLLGFPLAASAASDEAALTALLESTGGQNSPLADLNWGVGDPCNNWVGVTCASGRVTELKLNNLKLTGELPEDLKNLEKIIVLELSLNRFSGKLPDGLGQLAQLQTLKLDRNAFSGAIPITMKNLSNLSIDGLDLRYNMLSSSNSDETDTFLDQHQQVTQDWSTTQTVPPTNLKVTGVTIASVSLSWDPIEYKDNGGAYEIIVSADPDLSTKDDLIVKSDDKTSASITINGLNASSEYHFAIRSTTKNPGGTGIQLTSEFGPSVSAFTLLDTDRDGTADINDKDADNDGLSNTAETLTADTDADGIPDYLEPNNVDTDGDGKPNNEDDDDDNDGIITLNELGSTPKYPADSDNDGIRDYLDKDSTNTMNTADGSGDSDQDGLSDHQECPNPAHCIDTDGNGVANYMDADDDRDALPTADEGATVDSDSDGIINALEPNKRDTDGDGILDHEDNDDDGDGIPTRDEIGGDVFNAPDRDDDNIPDYLDADSSNAANTSDKSGDSDNDGISDYKECPNAPACPDANGDGIPSYMDADEKTEITSLNKVLGDGDTRGGGGGGTMGWPLLGMMLGLLAAFRKRFMTP